MTKLMSTKIVVLLTALVAATTLAAAPGDEGTPITTDAVGMDAAIYATDWGISDTEARRRLDIQRSAGVLNAILGVNEAETFAGLSIQHGPEFRVIAYFTRNGDDRIQPYIDGNPLADVVETRTAEVSVATLQTIQAEAMSLMHALGIPVESAIKIQDNHVELYALDPSTLQAAVHRSGLRLSHKVEVVAADQHSSEVADIYAGLELAIEYAGGGGGACTSGFSVEDSSGTKGLLTAMHCVDDISNDTVKYDGSELPIQAGSYGGSRDVMWVTAPDFKVRNLAYDGSGNRYIYSTKSRSQITDNEYICKYGITTKYGCGYVESTTYDRPTAKCKGGCTWSATWILVKPATAGVDLSEPGDSGGPWFFGNTAYGIMTSHLGDKAIFMSIDYIDVLDVTVLTK